jgi:hypothetical protein
MAVQFEVDQVVGEGKFIRVKLAVLVDVRELPAKKVID